MKGVIDTKGKTTVTMYASYNVQSEQLAELENKDVVEAIEKKGDWTHVQYLGVGGWIKSENVVLAKGVNGVADIVKKMSNVAANVVNTVTNNTTATTTNQVGKTMTVNTQKDPLVLRQTPTIKGTKITSIPKGGTVVIAQDGVTSADGYKWVKVNYNGKSGYVASEYLIEAQSGNKTDIPADNASDGGVDNNNNNNKKEKNMDLSENAKKYVKWGAIAAVAGVGIYFGYKMLTKKKSSGTKGLSGVGRKRKKFKRLTLK